jgi:hypothetical protein
MGMCQPYFSDLINDQIFLAFLSLRTSVGKGFATKIARTGIREHQQPAQKIQAIFNHIRFISMIQIACQDVTDVVLRVKPCFMLIEGKKIRDFSGPMVIKELN